MTIPDWPVSYRFRRAMEVADLDIEDVAERIGVSTGTIYNYVKGHTKPRRAALTILAEMSSLPLWWLEGNDEPPDPVVTALSDHRHYTKSDIRKARTLRKPAYQCIQTTIMAA